MLNGRGQVSGVGNCLALAAPNAGRAVRLTHRATLTPDP
jgi:hypothetical protein